MNYRLEDSKVTVVFDHAQCSIQGDVEAEAYSHGDPVLGNTKVSGPKNALITIYNFKLNNPSSEEDRINNLYEELKNQEDILLMNYTHTPGSGTGAQAPDFMMWVRSMSVRVLAEVGIVDSDGGGNDVCENLLNGEDKEVGFIYGRISNVFRVDGKIVFSMAIHGADWNTWDYAALKA